MSALVADAMVTIPKVHGPGTEIDEIRELFRNQHVHMALVVADDGRLLTTIERSDLHQADGARFAAELGTLQGRIVSPALALDRATEMLRRRGKRRLAVVDSAGHLTGLLCLKRDATGFCSDEGVRSRVRHP